MIIWNKVFEKILMMWSPVQDKVLIVASHRNILRFQWPLAIKRLDTPDLTSQESWFIKLSEMLLLVCSME